MKIKMLVSISGAGFSLSRGDETERFPENDALNLIKTGAAVLVADSSNETAVTGTQATETAIDAGAGEPETDAENAGSGDQSGTAHPVAAKAKGKAD